MSEWRETSLSEIVQIIPGYAFKGKHFGDNGTLIVKIKDINPPYVDLSSAQRVELANYPNKNLDKYKLEKGQAVLAMTGATIGKIGILRETEEVYVNQRVAKIAEKNTVNYKFAIYSISGTDFQTFIQNNIDSNSAQENISATSIGRYPISLPPIDEQRAIASVLSSLDDKIDLLHRQNQTLEQMAETLFRQWFVEEADEGWEISKIGDELKTILGGTPSTKKEEFWGGNIPWINSGEVNNFRILEATKYITELGLRKSNTKLLPKGTTVMAITGATLGQVSLLEIDTCANQSVVGIIPNEKFPKEFVFLWIKLKINEIILNETGGAQPHINKNDINETEIIVPDKKYLSKAMESISPMFDKITKNSFQIRTLTALRDTLLPKLMSGEVRVEMDETAEMDEA